MSTRYIITASAKGVDLFDSTAALDVASVTCDYSDISTCQMGRLIRTGVTVRSLSDVNNSVDSADVNRVLFCDTSNAAVNIDSSMNADNWITNLGLSAQDSVTLKIIRDLSSPVQNTISVEFTGIGFNIGLNTGQPTLATTVSITLICTSPTTMTVVIS